MARRLDTEIGDLVLVEPDLYDDERGFLIETFRDDAWRGLGVDVTFVQDNHSRSVRGILRGLHFQTSPGQAKLVRCLRGRVWDVAEGHELDDELHRQLFIPVGFAHGFCVLSEIADVAYKQSSYYDPKTESGIAWDDPDVGVEWPVADPRLSERDRTAPRLAEVSDRLPW